MQFLTAVRNSVLSAVSTALGAGGTIKIYTGAAPGVANAATGTLLSTLTALTLGTPSAGAMSVSATADGSAAASGTPGYARLLTSGAAVEVECTAGVGTAATMGTTTISGGAVATAPVSSGGTGYPTGTSYPVTFTGGGGSGATGYCTSTAGVLGNATITNGGTGYTSAPTATVPPPFDFTFAGTISLGGTVTLSSGTMTAGNA